jgi:hypothetical protein
MSGPAENSPNALPPKPPEGYVTDSLEAITIFIDGPGDTTIRPMDPRYLRGRGWEWWPRPQLPPRPDNSSKPPENGPTPPTDSPTPPEEGPPPPRDSST